MLLGKIERYLLGIKVMNTDYKISTTGEMRLRSIDKMPSLLPLNRQTEKLVILNYPFEGGGKFIGLVLALHPKFVHQERVLASLKMIYNYYIQIFLYR